MIVALYVIPIVLVASLIIHRITGVHTHSIQKVASQYRSHQRIYRVTILDNSKV